MMEMAKNRRRPTISIITINRNNIVGLKKTVNSIKSQKVQPNEYIIVDGTSTDKSLEFINLEKKHIQIVHYMIKVEEYTKQ